MFADENMIQHKKPYNEFKIFYKIPIQKRRHHRFKRE